MSPSKLQPYYTSLSQRGVMANRALAHRAKVQGIVPKVAWHWGGGNSVIKDPFGASGSTLSYVCLPPSWGSVGGDCFNSPVIVGLIWTTRHLQENRMVKAIKRSPVIAYRCFSWQPYLWEVPYGKRNSRTHPLVAVARSPRAPTLLILIIISCLLITDYRYYMWLQFP
jgi:hypothetical protein